MNPLRSFRLLGAFAAAISSSLVFWSTATAAAAGGQPVSAANAASDVPACIIYISGIEVDLGAASFRQCVSYARSSMIGKTDISFRNIRSNGTLYRISARLIETTMDDGKSWLPSLNNEQLLSRPGATLSTGTTAAAATENSATIQPPVSAAAAATPTAPKPTEAAGASSKEPSQPSMAAMPSVDSGRASASQQAAASTAVAAAVTPAARETTPVEVGQGNIVSRPMPAAAPPAPPLLSCDYSVEGTWKKLLARSVEECVKKIKVANSMATPQKSISAYWDKTFINVTGGNAYVSDNGKSWTLLN